MLEIQANQMNALINQGVELGRLEKNEEAIACYDKALEINPNDSNVIANIVSLKIYVEQK